MAPLAALEPAGGASFDVRAISASTWCAVAARCQSPCVSDTCSASAAACKASSTRPRRDSASALKRSAPHTRSGKSRRCAPASAVLLQISASSSRRSSSAASDRIWQASAWLREPSVPCSCGRPSSSSVIAASARFSPSRIEPVCIRHQPVVCGQPVGCTSVRARSTQASAPSWSLRMLNAMAMFCASVTADCSWPERCAASKPR